MQKSREKTEMQGLTPSTISPLLGGANVGSLPKRPFVGQKKPFSALGVPLPVASKKQKLTESFPDQSIEQLNDVTAVSGVNLREEEEKLLSMPKKENDVWGETRRLVWQEEENLFLQKLPLQIKLTMIVKGKANENISVCVMAALKCGIKNIGNDVERCLSLCMEERMRDLIGNLIRLSKQINISVSPANPYEHNKTLANNAARVAFEGSDMQSKWQNMAERAQHKCGGGRNIFPDIESRSSAAAASAPPLSGSLAKVSHTISIKDVIAVLEREPQMSKSTLLYCLHEQMCKNASAK
ncbi:hypothetical protein Syun_021429 [Stephania yunnanensis]|uniref:Transcription initiation factor TFIID component TAF4 C-terminal domain-containing protein n=1 Tax=Stephania yunnanensis TaxID=152371 RepID=A0AAP0IHK4_9MAGN